MATTVMTWNVENLFRPGDGFGPTYLSCHAYQSRSATTVRYRRHCRMVAVKRTWVRDPDLETGTGQTVLSRQMSP